MEINVLGYLEIFFTFLFIVGILVLAVSPWFVISAWQKCLMDKTSKTYKDKAASFSEAILCRPVAWQLYKDGWLMLLVGLVGYMSVVSP